MADRIGQQLGHYRLLRVLGQGAFADVYLAEHQYLERPAAIKVLHVRMEPETQEHFRQEARTIARLQHPHIVGVLDFGIEDQTPYLVMKYSPNANLARDGLQIPAVTPKDPRTRSPGSHRPVHNTGADQGLVVLVAQHEPDLCGHFLQQGCFDPSCRRQGRSLPLGWGPLMRPYVPERDAMLR